METSVNVSKCSKIISVIIGTLMGAFIWRCRGEGGFGSSWGLYSVGLVIILLVYTVYGRKSGMKFEKLLLGAFLTGLGVTGYATVMMQMSGVLNSDLPYQGEVVDFSINPYSGMIIEIIMGLTLIPLFSFFIGSLFGKKNYTYKDYIIVAVVFFAVQLLVKATIAHPIMKLINPEQTEYALMGLKDAGYEYESAAKAYLAHFQQRKWTQDIPFFENYYMSVEHISDLFATVCVSLYPLVVKKDKMPSIISAVINVFVGLVASFGTGMLYLGVETGLFANTAEPRFLENRSGWGIWEMTVGASVGFITMLVLALIPNKYTAQTEPDTVPSFKNNKLSFAYNFVASVFILAVTPCRVIGIRLGRLFENTGLTEDSHPWEEIIMIGGAVILGVYFLVKMFNNIIKNNNTPLNVTPVELSYKTLPAYMAMCAVAYFFLDDCYILTLTDNKVTGISSFFHTMTGSQCIEPFLMLIIFIVLIPLYIILKKQVKKGDICK